MASADKDGALTAADPLARQPDLLDQGARSWKKLEAKDRAWMYSVEAWDVHCGRFGRWHSCD